MLGLSERSLTAGWRPLPGSVRPADRLTCRRPLIITNDFPPRIGGIESFVESTSAELLDGDVRSTPPGHPGRRATDVDRGYPVVRDGAAVLPTPRVAARAAELIGQFGGHRVVFGAAAPLGLLAPALRRAGAEQHHRPDPRPRDLVGHGCPAPGRCCAGSVTAATT